MIVTNPSQCGPLESWRAATFNNGQVETWECVPDAKGRILEHIGGMVALPVLVAEKVSGKRMCDGIGGIICYPLGLVAWVALYYLLSAGKGRR